MFRGHTQGFLFSPKYRLGRPERYVFALSRNIFSGSKYQKICFLLLKTVALVIPYRVLLSQWPVKNWWSWAVFVASFGIAPNSTHFRDTFALQEVFFLFLLWWWDILLLMVKIIADLTAISTPHLAGMLTPHVADILTPHVFGWHVNAPFGCHVDATPIWRACWRCIWPPCWPPHVFGWHVTLCTFLAGMLTPLLASILTSARFWLACSLPHVFGWYVTLCMH